MSEYQREYYKKNKEKIKEYASRKAPEYKAKLKKCRDNVKYEVMSYYCKSSPACVKCGFSDIRALCLDHINSDGRNHRKDMGITSGYKFYCWLKKNNYPEGLQVLCSNCNLIKQHEQEEWRGVIKPLKE